VTVVTGFEQDGFVEILTPLNEEEPIVIVGQQGLKIDSVVKIIGEEELEEQHEGQNAELSTDNNTAKVTTENQAIKH